MVRNIMKQRQWWYLSSVGEKFDFQELNFVWTQWRKLKITQQLKTYKEYAAEKEQQLQNFSFPQVTLATAEKQEKSAVSNSSKVKKMRRNSGDVTLANPLLKIYGKLEDHFHLSNKKALFYNMRGYY